jgi:hypothetical protein
MKLPKATVKETKMTDAPIASLNQERWPYGLRINFEKEQIDKMPALAGLKVGDVVSIDAIGCVTSVRISERQEGKKDHSVEIQIEQVGIEPKKKPEKMSMKEFNAWREKGGGK